MPTPVPEAGLRIEVVGPDRAPARVAVQRAAFDELGSPSAFVATPSANVGAVATYRSAGFRPLPERRDLRRGDA